MAGYRFLTTWCLDARIEDAWEAIHAIDRWPEWWEGVLDVVELERGSEDGIGRTYAHRWRSVLPYVVEFRTRVTRLDRPFLLEAVADGELAGEGRFRLFEGRGTAVTYEWNVRTTRPWMNALAPVGRPVFAWNHHTIMRRGGEGLARRLGVRLVARS